MRRSLSAVMLVSVVGLVNSYASATSCIEDKRFKVKQVCGVILAPEGTQMSHVSVELVDLNTDLPDVIQSVETDQHGKFAMLHVPTGEYRLRARLSGFATATQTIVVTKRAYESGCEKPIRIQMQAVGRCSTISLIHKQ